MAGVVLIACLAPAALARTPPPQTSDERKQAAVEALVAGLEEFAAWCAGAKLHLEKAYAYEMLIEIDPDHGEARRALGYTKKGKDWKAPSKPHPFENRNPAALAEAEERRHALGERLLGEIEPFFEDPGAAPVEVQRLQEVLLRLDPNNEPLRGLRGEVRLASGGDGGGAWVLQETAAALRRNRELETMLASALEQAPPVQTVALEPDEAALGIPLSCAASSAVRVLATGEPREAEELARILGAMPELFRQLFGVEVSLPRGCKIYLLSTAEARSAFFERHPGITPEVRAQFETLEGAGIPGTGEWGWWEGDEAKRKDGVLRLSLWWFVQQGFGISFSQAWIQEGLGIYLTWRLAGTRLTWFIDASLGIDPRELYPVRSHLQDPAVDWLEEARAVLARGKVDLRPIFARQPHELALEDLLVSYAVAAYLVEGWPDKTPALLKELAQNPPEVALSTSLGLDASALPSRLLRWLEDRRALLEAEPVLAEAEMDSLWAALDERAKEKVLASFRSKIGELDTLQMQLLHSLVETRYAQEWPPAKEPEFYDPRVHAPADPIPRRLLEPDDPLLETVRAQMLRQRGAYELEPSIVYDWGTGTIVLSGDPDDPEAAFRNARNGYPPGMDLARALLLRALDGGHERKIFAAFAHTYTDRDGGIYPGVTLYDGWNAGVVIEMPDVDALGIIHDVFDDWKTWIAPIPGDEHDPLYAKIGELFQGIRRYRGLREALADCFLLAEPKNSPEYQALFTNLHALWAHHGAQPEKVAQVLPRAADWQRFIDDWVATCKKEPGVFEPGRRRQGQLKRDGEEVQRALSEALQEVSDSLARTPGKDRGKR